LSEENVILYPDLRFSENFISKGRQVKLDIRAFAIAQTVTAAIPFVICSFFVGLLPETAVSLARYAFHTDLSGIMRPFSVSGFIVGLLVVSVGWGCFSLIMASVYNSLTKNTASATERENLTIGGQQAIATR